jgi:Xaa-Pro aminopeptidase
MLKLSNFFNLNYKNNHAFTLTAQRYFRTSKNYNQNNNNNSSSSSGINELNSKTKIDKKVCKGKIGPIEELGQITYWTHPHLFSISNATDFSKQVTPGITKQEFEQRRTNYVNHLISYQAYYFSNKLSKAEKASLKESKNLDKINHNFIAIIPSSTTTFMAPDVMHTFKQNSDFLYLTGFQETDSVVVLSRTDSDVSENSYKTALFVKEKDIKKELWEGPTSGPELAPKLTGIHKAYPLKEFKNYLDSLIKETSHNKKITLWRYPTDHVKQESGPNCRIGTIEEDIDKLIEENASNKLIDMSEKEPINASTAASYFNTSRYFVQLCRVKKSKAELDIMRQACDISSEAFMNTMRITHPFINEHLIYSKFDYDCRIRGSEYLAYIPVVAGGPRATVLHYIRFF